MHMGIHACIFLKPDSTMKNNVLWTTQKWFSWREKELVILYFTFKLFFHLQLQELFVLMISVIIFMSKCLSDILSTSRKNQWLQRMKTVQCPWWQQQITVQNWKMIERLRKSLYLKISNEKRLEKPQNEGTYHWPSEPLHNHEYLTNFYCDYLLSMD